MRRRAFPGVRRPLRIVAAAMVAGLAAMLAGPQPARADCRPLAAEAEASFGIPPGILQAIALAESGVGGTAWPWTINARGRAFYLRSHQEALAVAEAATRHYGGSIALGCMQVYLRYHGERFSDLGQMLDPAVNVRYAATFLLALQRDHGSWEAAVRHYHASNPAAQATYLCRVLTIRRDLGYQTITDGMRRVCGVAGQTVARR